MKSPSKRMAATAAVAVFASVILAACATPPQHNDMLEHARGVVATAQSNPNVAGESRADLATAVAALNQGDAMIKAGKPTADVEHEAYIAERFGLAAQRGAEYSMSEKAIADAQNRRNAVLLSAREQQVRARQRPCRDEDDGSDASKRQRDDVHSKTQRPAAKPRSSRVHWPTCRRRNDRGLVITLPMFSSQPVARISKSGARRSLEKLAAVPARVSAAQLQIEGFTDSVGTDDYNQGLSERRAGLGARLF